MRLSIGIAAIVSSLVLTSGSPARAETSSIDGREAMTRALQGAWLPLESGLIVGAREGTPLSAKYEIDDGAFQLSVYTSKPGASSGDAFTEIIVDYSAWRGDQNRAHCRRWRSGRGPSSEGCRG